MWVAVRSNVHDEPCLECGEETAVGSYFFSDRHNVELPNGARGYVCSDCINRIRSAKFDALDLRGRSVAGRAYGMTYMLFGRVTPRRDIDDTRREI
jgi:hypothetical protein